MNTILFQIELLDSQRNLGAYIKRFLEFNRFKQPIEVFFVWGFDGNRVKACSNADCSVDDMFDATFSLESAEAQAAIKVRTHAAVVPVVVVMYISARNQYFHVICQF